MEVAEKLALVRSKVAVAAKLNDPLPKIGTPNDVKGAEEVQAPFWFTTGAMPVAEA